MANSRANLVTNLTLNTSGFSKNLSKSKKGVSQFSKSIQATMKTAVKGVKALAVGFVALGAGIAVGVKNALALGGRLSDVAEQTGLSVKKIAIWEEAMRQGGVEGEVFGAIVNKMQKSIHDLGRGLSTQKSAFGILGLAFKDLEEMSPDEQLDSIIRALKQLPNLTKKIGAARDIFGRQGSRIFAAIFDEEGMEKAVRTLGKQVELLDKNAITFDRISDVIGGIGKKIQGFFVGISDKIAPELLELAEKWTNLDFAEQGQTLGEEIKKWFNGDGWQETVRVISDSLTAAAIQFGKALSEAVGIALGELSSGIIQNAPNSGLGKHLRNIDRASKVFWQDMMNNLQQHGERNSILGGGATEKLINQKMAKTVEQIKNEKLIKDAKTFKAFPKGKLSDFLLGNAETAAETHGKKVRNLKDAIGRELTAKRAGESAVAERPEQIAAGKRLLGWIKDAGKNIGGADKGIGGIGKLGLIGKPVGEMLKKGAPQMLQEFKAAMGKGAPGQRPGESTAEYFARTPFKGAFGGTPFKLKGSNIGEPLDIFAKGVKKAVGGAVFRKDTKEEKQISFFQQILDQLKMGTTALNENLGPLDF